MDVILTAFLSALDNTDALMPISLQSKNDLTQKHRKQQFEIKIVMLSMNI